MKKDKIYCFIDRIKFIFKLIKDLKLSLLIVCLFLCVINVILPYITMINTQEIINRIQIGLSIRLILKRLIIFLILGILYIISSNLYNFLILKYKEYLYLELNKKFLDNSLKFNLKDFENPEVYNIIQRAEQEIGIRPYNIIISLLSIISQSVNLISAFLILTKWHLTLIIGFILLASFASKYFISISKNEYDILMNRTNYERKSWYISHLLIKDEYIKEVRLFGLSKYLIQQFIELRSRFFKENVDVLKRQYIFSEIYQLMNYVISFFIIFLAIYESTQGILLVGTAMTYINTSSKIENAIQNIVSNIFGIYKDSLYIDNIKKYFNYEANKFNEFYNDLVKKNQKLIHDIYEKDIQMLQTQLEMLQTQINPHFLYNTLESVYLSLEVKGEKESANIVYMLSKLFKYALKERNTISLNKEVEMVKMYLEIEKYRFGKRLAWEITLDQVAKDITIPKLLLQPLVENAVKHGIELSKEGGMIDISITTYEEILVIVVNDDGVGISPEKIIEIGESLNKKENIQKKIRSSIGLKNVYERLIYYYGENAKLDIESADGEYTEVTVIIPDYRSLS